MDKEAPVYLTGVIACMVSRAAEIVVIILLRVVFVTSNNRRDKALASGQIEYDPRHTPLDDVSDWKNPAFRYVTVSCCSSAKFIAEFDSSKPINFVLIEIGFENAER